MASTFYLVSDEDLGPSDHQDDLDLEPHAWPRYLDGRQICSSCGVPGAACA